MEPQFEIQGAVAKRLEIDEGLRAFQDHFIFRGDFMKDGVHLPDIGPVSDADRDIETPASVFVSPVADRTVDQLGIGQHDRLFLKRLDLGCANADLLDGSAGNYRCDSRSAAYETTIWFHGASRLSEPDRNVDQKLDCVD